MTQIKKIETRNKQNWMDDLNNAIEAKINSFICAMEANINCREEDLKKDMECLKKDMEALKEGGTNLLQERPPNDENIDMRKFDGKNPITWIL